jgi:hypothetical protein
MRWLRRVVKGQELRKRDRRRLLAPGPIAATAALAAFALAQCVPFEATVERNGATMVSRQMGLPVPMRFCVDAPLLSDSWSLNAVAVNLVVGGVTALMIGGIARLLPRYSIRALLVVVCCFAVGFARVRQRQAQWNEDRRIANSLERCRVLRENILPAWAVDWNWVEQLPKWMRDDVTRVEFLCFEMPPPELRSPVSPAWT